MHRQIVVALILKLAPKEITPQNRRPNHFVVVNNPTKSGTLSLVSPTHIHEAAPDNGKVSESSRVKCMYYQELVVTGTDPSCKGYTLNK